jgi:hypothetical protein
MGHSHVEHSIEGEYQLRALLHGWPPQRAWHRGRLDLVDALLPPALDSLSLDAAAGAGIVMWMYRRPRLVSADMRVSACQAIRSHTPGARTAAADVGHLPFRTATFSQIYFLEVIEHLSAEAGKHALAELRRVARSGARCLITTPNYHSYWVLAEWALDRLRLTPPMAGGQHVSRYDRRSLCDAVRAGGWNVVRSGTFNAFGPPLALLSRRAAERACRWEASRTVSFGPLLYCLCEAA